MDVHSRINQGDVPSRQIEMDGRGMLPATGNTGRHIADEEGTIGTQFCCDNLELCWRYAEAKMGVEKGEGESAVCASSAQTCSGGEDLNEVKVYRGKDVAFGEDRIGPADQVVAWVAFDGVAVEVQKALFSGAWAHQFKCVIPGYRQE